MEASMRKNMFKLSIIWYIFVELSHVTVAGTDREMTISIDPGREECFYQTVKKDQILDVEYQVIDGGQGDLDINFRLVSPSGRPVVADYRKSDNAHRNQVEEDGDYKICWDNTFSHFNSKTVFFELVVESGEEEEDLWDNGLDAFNGITPDEIYDMKVQDIQDAMNRVRVHLSKARHLQDQLRAFEARDRNVQESSYTRVNNWSIIQIIAMLVVGGIQVVMVRSLFDEGSRIHKIWKKSTSS